MYEYNKTKTNTELLQTMRNTTNNMSTTTEPLHLNEHQGATGGSLNAFYRRQIFALDSVVVKAQNCLAPMEAF